MCIKKRTKYDIHIMDAIEKMSQKCINLVPPPNVPSFMNYSIVATNNLANDFLFNTLTLVE